MAWGNLSSQVYFRIPNFTYASPAATVATAAPLGQHILIRNLIGERLPPYGLNEQPVYHQGYYANESDN